MAVLAIDLGRHMGWAVADNSAVAAWPTIGEMSTGPVDGVSYGSNKFKHRKGPFFIETMNFVSGLITQYKPDIVAFEGPLARNQPNNVVRSMIGQATAVEMAAAMANIPCGEKENNAIRKHFTGSGKANKQLTIDVCNRRGWNPENDNAADALGVLDYAVHAVYIVQRG